jgi:sporulation protein YlmC with PRC-barrel domain
MTRILHTTAVWPLEKSLASSALPVIATAVLVLHAGVTHAADRGPLQLAEDHGIRAPARVPTLGPVLGAPTGPGACAGATRRLLQHTARELTGMEVVSAATGEEVGRVEILVRNATGTRVSAVVAVGGLLGIGGRNAVVPIEDFSRVDDQLILGVTKETWTFYPEYRC